MYIAFGLYDTKACSVDNGCRYRLSEAATKCIFYTYCYIPTFAYVSLRWYNGYCAERRGLIFAFISVFIRITRERRLVVITTQRNIFVNN